MNQEAEKIFVLIFVQSPSNSDNKEGLKEKN
jgi:hypothetical protein